MDALGRGVEGKGDFGEGEGGCWEDVRGEAFAPALFSWAKRRRDMTDASKHEVTRFRRNACCHGSPVT